MQSLDSSMVGVHDNNLYQQIDPDPDTVSIATISSIEEEGSVADDAVPVTPVPEVDDVFRAASDPNSALSSGNTETVSENVAGKPVGEPELGSLTEEGSGETEFLSSALIGSVVDRGSRTGPATSVILAETEAALADNTAVHAEGEREATDDTAVHTEGETETASADDTAVHAEGETGSQQQSQVFSHQPPLQYPDRDTSDSSDIEIERKEREDGPLSEDVADSAQLLSLTDDRAHLEASFSSSGDSTSFGSLGPESEVIPPLIERLSAMGVQRAPVGDEEMGVGSHDLSLMKSLITEASRQKIASVKERYSVLF